MGRKTPISLNLQKYVEKHWNGPHCVRSKTQKQGRYNTDYIAPDLIDFFWRWLKSDQDADSKEKYLYL